MYNWKTIESGLARQRKAQIAVSKYDVLLSSVIFVDCLLKVFSVLQCWMVTTILEFSVILWKLSKKLTQ